jgi:hypothetical protein
MRILLTTIAALSLFSLQTALACETYQGFTMSEEICWNDGLKSYISKRCAGSCQALGPFKARVPATVPERRINTSTLACKRIGAEVVVLGDKNKNEMSFCLFEDGSLRDAASVELLIP